MRTAQAVVDARLVIRREDLDDEDVAILENRFTRENPRWKNNERMGFSNRGVAREVRSWDADDWFLYLPRGVVDDVRSLLRGRGVELLIKDRTLEFDPQGFSLNGTLRDYQPRAVQATLGVPGGALFRGPCGCGKTVTLLALIVEADQPTLVVVHSTALADQWKKNVAEWLGVIPGSLTGRGKKVIRPVTVATQKTILGMVRSGAQDLTSKFGCLVGDEIHKWAAPTFLEVVSQFPAKYRFGASANEKRKDGLEFLVYEAFGPCAYKIKRNELETLGHLLPIHMIIARTGYEDPIYLDSKEVGESDDWRGMIDRMTTNESRNRFLLSWAEHVLEEDPANRVLMLSERVEHCELLADEIARRGFKSGLMLGGPANRKATAAAIADLSVGRIRMAAGTSVADEGLDIPPLTHVIPTCPQHNNPGRLEQMIGRTARPDKGRPAKVQGVCIYPWDDGMFPNPFVEPKKDGTFAYGAEDADGVREARVDRFLRTITKGTGSHVVV